MSPGHTVRSAVNVRKFPGTALTIIPASAQRGRLKSPDIASDALFHRTFICEDTKISPVTGRSTDYATEERQIRRREEKAGVEQWFEDVFFALGEVTFLSLPAFVALMDAEPNAPVKFTLLVAWATLTLTVGTLRYGQFGVEWPPMTPSQFVVRLVYYNAAVTLIAYAGANVDLALRSPVVTAGVAALLSVCATWGFARLVRTAAARAGRPASGASK